MNFRAFLTILFIHYIQGFKLRVQKTSFLQQQGPQDLTNNAQFLIENVEDNDEDVEDIYINVQHLYEDPQSAISDIFSTIEYIFGEQIDNSSIIDTSYEQKSNNQANRNIISDQKIFSQGLQSSENKQQALFRSLYGRIYQFTNFLQCPDEEDSDQDQDGSDTSGELSPDIIDIDDHLDDENTDIRPIEEDDLDAMDDVPSEILGDQDDTSESISFSDIQETLRKMYS